MAHAPKQPAYLVASNEQDQTVVAPPITPLFPLGKVVSTPGALDAMHAANTSPLSLLRRHITGDWGDLDKQDKQLNDLAIKDGSRIFSSYNIAHGQRLWIITEADRNSTCLLKPEDY